LFGIAVGQLGMSSDDFYQCTLVEVMAAVNAFYEFHNSKDAAEWERMRMSAFYSLKPHDSKNKIKRPNHLFPLPHDKAAKEIEDMKSWLDGAMEMDRISSKRFAKAAKEGRVKYGKIKT
jgi:hypothetical protein